MAIDVKSLLRVVPTIQAAGLAKRNADFALKKRKKAGSLVNSATENIVGTALITTEAALIESLT